MPLAVRLFAVAFALLVALPAQAQADPDSTLQTRPIDEPEERGGARTADDEVRRYDQLVARFQRPYLRFTALVQIVPYVPLEDDEDRPTTQAGFDVAAARFGIAGQLDGGIGYQLRADFVREPALLDAFVSYGTRDVRGIVGLQRVPFSYEQLTSAASIDFVNRSRAVRTIAPPREVGAELRLVPGGGPLVLRLGLFNAAYDYEAGLTSYGGLLFAGRAQLTLGSRTDRQLIVGANGGYETADTSDGHDIPGRVVAGADARLRYGRVLLAAEGLLVRTDDDPYAPYLGRFSDREGGYVTAGFDVTRKDRALARLDLLSRTDPEVLLGYNRQLTRAASLQANAVIPAGDAAGRARLLFNVQLGF